MSRRMYAYWRDSGGAPNEQDDDRGAPREILTELGKISAFQGDEQVVWRSPLFPTLRRVLLGSIVVLAPDDRPLNDRDTHQLITKSLTEVVLKHGANRPITPTEFLESVNDQAAEFFRLKPRRYSLITTLSVKSLPRKSIRIDGCRITSLTSRKRYPFPNRLIAALREPDFHLVEPDDSQQGVLVQTVGRSPHDAAERGMESLYLLCGLWNLFTTFRQVSLFSILPRKPLGVVHVGPIHTLHDASGVPCIDEFWYEPDYPRRLTSYSPPNGWETVEKKRRWAQRRIRNCRFEYDLRRLIIRYARALTRSDPNAAFLQMWSILETITGTIGRRYDETIKLATWFIRNPRLDREILSFLRSHRNQYVHAARSDDENPQIAQVMKYYVDPHLLLLLRNDLEVAGLDKYAGYLRLPTAVDELARKRSAIQRAIRIRRAPRRLG